MTARSGLGGLVLLLASVGCGGGPKDDDAIDAGTDAAPTLDSGPESGVDAAADAGEEPDAGDPPECWDCGPGQGFTQPSIRDEVVSACDCAHRTYRRDFYDALASCLAAGCEGVDACYEDVLADLDATPVALEAIDICEGRSAECAFHDCRFLAGFEDDVLEDYLGCLYAVDCGGIVACVDFGVRWCEVY